MEKSKIISTFINKNRKVTAESCLLPRYSFIPQVHVHSCWRDPAKESVLPAKLAPGKPAL